MKEINKDELFKKCEELIKFLKEKCNPYTQIIINMDCIKIVEDTYSLPISLFDKNEIYPK